MNNWITIITFNLPSEVVVLRSRLESEGIECFVKNELTTQIYPIYSNAVGGVQLQVKESDLQNAITILKDSGYYTEKVHHPSKYLLQFESITSKIPFLKNLPLLFRLMVLIIVIVGFSVSFLIHATLPTTYEKLTSNFWCVNKVSYNGKDYQTNTTEYIQVDGLGFCQEYIDFRTNGKITMPGFNSRGIRGIWKLNDNKVHIMQSDTFEFVYNGLYEIDFHEGDLLLKSSSATIFLQASKYKH